MLLLDRKKLCSLQMEKSENSIDGLSELSLVADCHCIQSAKPLTQLVCTTMYVCMNTDTLKFQ